MEDSYGFPSAPTPSQRSRFRVRAFTSTNTWSLRFPSLSSALSGSPSDLASLSLAHGIPTSYRADLWLRAARAVSGNRATDYAADARRVSTPPTPTPSPATSFSDIEMEALEVNRQIELDLPRTFAEQHDFSAALEARALLGGALDGSRSSAAAAASAATAASGGDVHDALRRMLRVFCARNRGTGYLQSMNFVAAFLLIVFGRERESDAFEVFEILITRILPGYYTPTMALLR
jgi:hypothetical protein